MLHVAAGARSKAATGICVFQVSPTKKQPGVDRTGREERSERAWRAAPSAVLDPAPSAVVRQLSISAVLRDGVGDAPTRPLRAANASAEPAYRDPGESARGPSAATARLRTTGSSAIATPLPTRPPTGDDADDADDADADDVDNDNEEAMARIRYENRRERHSRDAARYERLRGRLHRSNSTLARGRPRRFPRIRLSSLRDCSNETRKNIRFCSFGLESSLHDSKEIFQRDT